MSNSNQLQLVDRAGWRPRILVVDDLTDNCTLLKFVLEQEGYQVETAEDGYTAIAKVENQPPDLVLLDVMMPDLDGYEVTRWIEYNRPNVPILLVTSCYDSLPAVFSAKIVGCVHKPIDIDSLLSKVKAIVWNSASRLEALALAM